MYNSQTNRSDIYNFNSNPKNLEKIQYYLLGKNVCQTFFAYCIDYDIRTLRRLQRQENISIQINRNPKETYNDELIEFFHDLEVIGERNPSTGKVSMHFLNKISVFRTFCRLYPSVNISRFTFRRFWKSKFPSFVLSPPTRAPGCHLCNEFSIKIHII